MSAPFKVCITAAGRGTRLKAAAGTNKALAPVAHRAVLSRILDSFPREAEVVIALGHEAQQIRDFLDVTVRGRRFVFVDVHGYDGPGSGPGASLLQCRPHLDCPFVLVACDTLIDGDVPAPDVNWIGVAPVQDSAPFLIADVSQGQVRGFFDKCAAHSLPAGVAAPYSAFIGLAGIRDHEAFWEGLDRDARLVAGERQVAAGLEALMERGLTARAFTWHDTGTDEGLRAADAHYGVSGWLLKPDETLYFEGGRVVKYFADASRARKRAERALLLRDVVPPHAEARGHFLAYDYVPGSVMSESLDDQAFCRFVTRAAETVWKPLVLSAGDAGAFAEASDRFYRVKTQARVASFLERYPQWSGPAVVNGVPVPAVSEALAAVDWPALASGVPVRFHGDPQPENILLADSGDVVMLDWREDFGGLSFGDLYYDLAKVHHALIVSGEIVRGGHFGVEVEGDRVEVRILLREHLIRFLKVFEHEVVRAGWDLGRTRLVSALTYLNIAPLHHDPYDRFLYFFGRQLLQLHVAGRWPY